jgi:hypothetical protein
MKSQFVILGAIAAVAVDPTNTTITPDNSTLFLENGANISQPGTPLLMPLENVTTGNLTDTNITG